MSFIAGVVGTGEQLIAGVVDTGNKHKRCEYLHKYKWPNGILRGLGETDS
jgi:hypothetical protein